MAYYDGFVKSPSGSSEAIEMDGINLFERTPSLEVIEVFTNPVDCQLLISHAF